MNTFFKILAAVLLAFNAAGAIYGGWNLMTYPDGSSLDMSTKLLEHSPFGDFLIPGIILFLFNGVLSLTFLAALLLNAKNTPWLLIFQGFVLGGWIVGQMIMLQTVNSLHILFGSIGFALILIGALMIRSRRLSMV